MGISNKEYCGTIVMTVNGAEYEVRSVKPTLRTGHKIVTTMNSKKRALGTSCGSKEVSLDIEAYIPLDGSEPDWDNMKGATIVCYPACGTGGKREIYIGCTTEEVGSSYNVGDSAVRSIKMHALDKEVV
ncbi:hypothetical protein EDC30_102218 [Paucimonas lemoignei]|uniref:Uncharacterized protein n=1 Tax=Paucimonas lemoignei TaxID=29443 RepID=A0A4R3I3H9_PAULE|nr:phage tail protein [Paucimonas lemoignei]TCS38479.1 hypothetical protein EDC30_102218 [Paucimonas lemoignei]